MCQLSFVVLNTRRFHIFTMQKHLNNFFFNKVSIQLELCSIYWEVFFILAYLDTDDDENNGSSDLLNVTLENHWRNFHFKIFSLSVMRHANSTMCKPRKFLQQAKMALRTLQNAFGKLKIAKFWTLQSAGRRAAPVLLIIFLLCPVTSWKYIPESISHSWSKMLFLVFSILPTELQKE